MKQATINPSSNTIGPGINDSDINEAIRKAGYPLQAFISNILKENFSIQEEWCFIDPKTKEMRAIDILAEKRLFKLNIKNQPRVRPILDLIIECKQSELPYIFFLSNNKGLGSSLKSSNIYPLLSGLFHKSITIYTDDDLSSYSYPIIDCLNLDSNKFLSSVTPSCTTFSKCVRKGKDISLSGVDAYQNLIMPLIKSLQHFDNTEKPPETSYYFDCHITFAVGVIDAPMVGVKAGKTLETELLPWVRVLRHESYENEDWTKRQKIFSLDIVHKDYFKKFLEENLLPFVNSLSSLVLKHNEIIAEGKAFAKGMKRNHFKNIENRLEKKSFRKSNIISKLIKK